MGQGNESGAVPKLDDQIVAGYARHSLAETPPLAQRVGHQGQLGSSCHVIDLAIVHLDHDAMSGGQNGSAMGKEPFHRFGGKKSPPITAIRSPVAMVQTDEVDGIPPTQQV